SWKMSQTIPISSTSKKRLDEKNGKIVKELSQLPDNRNCVECGMRGPTYVDVTTTSFCCSTCAGVLRGINPPHRIKSISMATFTCEEVESLKNGGNELNRRTWMGLHSGQQTVNFTSKDERTNFITQKYEKRKWYVSPEEVAKQKELLDRAVEAKSEQLKTTSVRNDPMDVFSSLSVGGNPSSRPPPSVSLDSVFAPPSMLGGVTLDRVIGFDEPHPFSPPAFMAPPPPPPGSHPTSLNINQQPTHMPVNFAFGSPPSGLLPQSHPPAMVSPPAALLSPVDPFSPLTATAKLFPRDTMGASSSLPPSSMESFGGDPFATSTAAGGDPFGGAAFSGFAVKFDDDTPTVAQPSRGGEGGRGTVNPFDLFGMTPSQGASVQSAVVPPPSSSSIDPFSYLVSLPSWTAVSLPVAAPTPPPPPASASASTSVPPSTVSPPVPPAVSTNDADKYSALAELDELFHSTTISGDTSNSNGKPSWVSTGFSAPPPTVGAAFPPSGMGKSSTMGAISSLAPPSTGVTGGGTSPSFWTVNTAGGGGPVPFSPLQGYTHSNLAGAGGLGGIQPQSTIYPSNAMVSQQSEYAQAAAMTGNPFSAFPPSQERAPYSQQYANGGHPVNPNWNPFL
ncbi:hypothetical protein PMAYCL1PPCAC_02592, partial [Pristionchus mayeri]